LKDAVEGDESGNVVRAYRQVRREGTQQPGKTSARVR
jgi:hypothetical protein